MPFSFKNGVQVLGFPADVKTIFTPSSFRICMISSMLGYNIGTLTPKGLSVAFLHFWMCSLKTSGYIDPAPINPKPPALLTALANLYPLFQIIPPWIIGYFILKSWVILFIIILIIFLELFYFLFLIGKNTNLMPNFLN